MITLGIDHALSGPCGLAIVDNGGGPAVLLVRVLVYAGSFDERSQHLHSVVAALLASYGVSALACEATYSDPDFPHAALVLEHAAGLLHALAIGMSIPFVRVAHVDTDAVKARLPRPWLVLPEIAKGKRVHAQDAIAIAWHGAGLAERTGRLEAV